MMAPGLSKCLADIIHRKKFLEIDNCEGWYKNTLCRITHHQPPSLTGIKPDQNWIDDDNDVEYIPNTKGATI